MKKNLFPKLIAFCGVVALALAYSAPAFATASVWTIQSRQRYEDSQGVQYERVTGTYVPASTYTCKSATGTSVAYTETATTYCGDTMLPQTFGITTIKQARFTPEFSTGNTANYVLRYVSAGKDSGGTTNGSVRAIRMSTGIDAPTTDISDLTSNFEVIGTPIA